MVRSLIFLFGLVCTVCPLAPLPDRHFITAAGIGTIQRWLISISVGDTLVLALAAVSVGGVLVRTTRLLATPTGARNHRGPPFSVIRKRIHF